MLTEQGFHWIADTAERAIDKYFTNITLPELKFEKLDVEVKIYNIACKKISVGNVSVDIQDQLNGKVTGFTFHCNCRWELREKLWPHPHKHGDGDAHTDGASASLSVGVSDDPSGHATVNANSVDVDVGDLKIHIHGGLIGDILEFLKNILKHWIEKHVEETVEEALTSAINDKINQALQEIPTEIDLLVNPPYNVSLIEMGITSMPTVSSSFIGAGLQGYFVDNQEPSKLPPFDKPSL